MLHERTVMRMFIPALFVVKRVGSNLNVLHWEMSNEMWQIRIRGSYEVVASKYVNTAAYINLENTVLWNEVRTQ
jgi:hypothetical protein